MDEVAQKKREMDEKLQQDQLRLAGLRESLQKSDQLTREMVNILDSFTTRLKRMDEMILPVYDQTRRLTRLQDNVDKTLQQVEKVIAYHHIADEVEIKIHNGPGDHIEPYLKVLDRLKQAVDFFQHNNPGSVELSHVNDLFETGLESLQKEFLSLLKKHSKPVPVAVLTDIVMDEDDVPPLEHLPPRTVMDLNLIAQYLINTGGNADITSMYSQIRSNQLGRSLNALKEANQGAQFMPSSIPKKSSFGFLTKQTPTKRQPKRAADAPLRRGEGAPGRLGTSVEPSQMEDQLEGLSSFLASATVFLRLIQSEDRLMRQIIPSQHHALVLDSLTKQPIDFFMRDGETLFQQAKRSVSRHDYSVVISGFRLIKHVQVLLPQYKAVLEGLPSQPFDRFPHLMMQFEKLNLKALDDYTQYIKGDPEKQSNLPKDGTVHELTSSTMWFAERLLDYSRIVSEVLLGQTSFGVRSTDIERNAAVGQYLVRVLDALNINLENKARSYESPFLAAIFLMNNYHFVHKTFSKNTLMLQLMEDVFRDIDDHYVSLVTTQARAYQRCFTKLIGFLGQEATYAGGSGPDKREKLNKQTRQLLKDKFKGFNTELEDLFKVQEHWSIPDAQLRARMRDDNVETVCPLYGAFYKVYSGKGFTKNPEKYLKYKPEDLETKLRCFFDGGAA